MRIIPVIDVMGGVVVRAVGGRRDEYRPLVSQLTDSTDPIEVAEALLEATGAKELYVADLDAIRTSPTLSPNIAGIARIARTGAAVWVDYGHREDFDEAELLNTGVAGLVLGTETVTGIHTVIHTVLMTTRTLQIVLSVDLRNGRLCYNSSGWACRDGVSTDEFLQRAVQDCNLTKVLILELASVGTLTGPNTVDMCGRVRTANPNLELWTGGGVRDGDDVKRLEDAGADAVLVASALHDGRLRM